MLFDIFVSVAADAGLEGAKHLSRPKNSGKMSKRDALICVGLVILSASLIAVYYLAWQAILGGN